MAKRFYTMSEGLTPRVKTGADIFYKLRARADLFWGKGPWRGGDLLYWYDERVCSTFCSMK
jgi:hypothetical protein